MAVTQAEVPAVAEEDRGKINKGEMFMKSKITLIILLVIILFLIALSIFFGVNYMKNRLISNALNDQIANLTDLLEEKHIELDEQNEENGKNKTTYFVSEDNKYLLILVDAEDRNSSDDVERYFILVESDTNSSTTYAGEYNLEEGEIALMFNNQVISINNVNADDVNGTARITLDYDEENGTVMLGETQLVKK